MRRSTLSILLLVALLALVGCGGEDEPSGGNTDSTFELPSFAIASSVFGDTGSATYVSVLGSLDVSSVDSSKASEYPGFATIAAVDGKLFVGDGAAPVITRYNVNDAGKLSKEGSLSFGPRGLQTAPLYHTTFLGPELAYVQFEQNKRVLWNPASLELAGAAVVTEGLDATRDGLRVISAFDRGIAVRDDAVFHPYYWTDDNYYAFAPTSTIAVFSADEGSLVDLLEAPCPGLDFVTSDEEGNLYFSNWVLSAAYPVLEASAAPSCAVRIKRGERTIDEGWTRNLSELVEGRQTAAFRYLGENRAIVAALHTERIQLTAGTDPSEISQASNWRLWQLDLSEGIGAPVDGLGWMAGGYYAFQLGGKTLLLLPSENYETTTVYELRADGEAVERFTVPGWAYQLVEIR